MGANNFTIKSAATAITVTGGTDVTYSETAKQVPNGLESSVATVADFRVRPLAEFVNRQPVLQADGSYSKAKRTMKLVQPTVLTTGKMNFNVVRVSVEYHPDTTEAELLEMRLRAAQLIGLAAPVGTFWTAGVVR